MILTPLLPSNSQILSLAGIKGRAYTFCEDLHLFTPTVGCHWHKYNPLDATHSRTVKRNDEEQEKCLCPASQVSRGAVCCKRWYLPLSCHLTGIPQSCSCRPQLEQCSCGALVKGRVILTKYWQCHSAFMLRVQTG